MKRRPSILILMDLLELLAREPRGPTRLAQAANLNYRKCEEFLGILSANQLVEKDVKQGHEVYSATLKGKGIFMRWESIFKDLSLP